MTESDDRFVNFSKVDKSCSALYWKLSESGFAGLRDEED